MGFSSKNTGVDCHSLLQGIFLTQRLNLGLLNCRQILKHLSYRCRWILYCLSHQGSPDIRMPKPKDIATGCTSCLGCSYRHLCPLVLHHSCSVSSIAIWQNNPESPQNMTTYFLRHYSAFQSSVNGTNLLNVYD